MDRLIEEAKQHVASLACSIANLRDREGTEPARAALETELENTTTRMKRLEGSVRGKKKIQAFIP